jgi:hypothetical protein
MEKIMRTNFFLVYVCGGFVLAAVCTARADSVLWYNGDLRSGGGGTVNEQTSNVGVSFIYDNFTVTDPAGWIVDRLWSNDAMQLTGISQASWYIRSGMSVGNGGAVVSSGIGFATQTPTGRVNPAIGFTEYSIQISGLNVYLSPGTYWLSVAPLVGSESGGMLKSYVSATSGANAVGTPPGNDANSLFYSPWLGYNYASAFQTDYSMGIAGSVVPEPSYALLMAGGVSVFVIRRRRA